jgi:hypothetical protein
MGLKIGNMQMQEQTNYPLTITISVQIKPTSASATIN